MCASLKRSRVKTYADAMRQKVIVGAGAVAAASWDYAHLHKNVFQGNFDIVSGYKGTNEIVLAMERGEVEMTCGADISSLRSMRPDVAGDNGFNLLSRVSVKPEPELDALGVPESSTFARDAKSRAIGDLVGAQQVFGRPYLVAPGVPQERVDILRAAFDALMREEGFRAEAAALGLAIDAANGVRVEEALRAMYAAPAEIIDGARAAIRP
jgi:hypothetical protein